MTLVRTPFVAAMLGTSLTTGRLSGDWVPRLEAELRQQPEAVGPVRTLNLGKGSQDSAWGLTQVPLIVALQPSHVLFEGFAINDCIDGGGGPAISRADHIQNVKDIIDGLVAGIPGVDLTLQTMSTISTLIVGTRPAYPDYVADEIATAALKGVRCLDNYAGWPSPLDPLLTNGRVLFVHAAPAGFSGWDVAATWNPADKNAKVTLSGGDLVMTGGAVHGMARATQGKAAGKLYFEVAATAAGANNIGIATAAASIVGDAYVGGDAAGYGYYGTTGDLMTGGVAAANFGTYGTGALIGVAVDFAAGKAWWAKNGVWLNGDPAAGTGGHAIAAATYYPAASAGAGGVNTGQFADMPGDGLHPLGPGGVDVYLYPNVLAWARARMTEHFGL